MKRTTPKQRTKLKCSTGDKGKVAAKKEGQSDPAMGGKRCSLAY
jgi:hypothetical protein